MKIVVLLIALLVGFCFACKNTLDERTLLAERQQLLASVTAQEAPVQPQATTIL